MTDSVSLQAEAFFSSTPETSLLSRRDFALLWVAPRQVDSMEEVQFRRVFKAVTTHDHFHWQYELYLRFVQGKVPHVCGIPTGLGKTSVIPIWVIALAESLSRKEGAAALPRRLVYIVNRRTVVDQATNEAVRLRDRITGRACVPPAEHEILDELNQKLLRYCSVTRDDVPIAISTLRGELADNGDWKTDPARPAIIIGTIDMIGSKLLFSGYGDRQYWRAQHAGLIGQDSLLVHDEAHLTPALSEVLRYVAETQRQAHEPRPVSTMELSATSRGGDGPILRLGPEDEQDEMTGKIVKDRLDATKCLHLREVEASDFIGKLVDLSEAHEGEKCKVLIYVRSPDDAKEVAEQLNKRLSGDPMGRAALLTGTIRGHERDKLVNEDPVYLALQDPKSRVERTVYLVSTSAGEVGIDLDADHMVCDLATLDSVIQRLGRVNRRGGNGRVARVDLVVKIERQGREKDTSSEFDRAIECTRAVLDRWTTASLGVLDVSPRGLRTLLTVLDEEERAKAFAPKPILPPLTDILLDMWSLTSLIKQMPGRPEVAPYLHGLTNDPPETYIAWRKEVALLNEVRADVETLCDWFQACPIGPTERLRERTDRVKRTLEGLLKAHRKKVTDRDFPVVLLNERGDAQWSSMSAVVERDDPAYRTIVLPVEARGLNAHGALDAKAQEDISHVTLDVAEGTIEDHTGERRERWLLTIGADGERYERLMTGEMAESLPHGLSERERVTLQQPSEGAEEGGQWRYLLVMIRPQRSALENPETVKTEQLLDKHTRRTIEQMAHIVNALGLGSSDPLLKEALSMAAEGHDLGKARLVWQRYACNPHPDTPLAKSRKYLHWRALGGYRHEFGSLLEAAANGQVRSHAEGELILHLIAAHHGRARPHFGPDAWDHTRTTAENEQAAAGGMRRFGRLQQRFGRWGLAWLESLLRCADIAASKPDDELSATSQESRA